MKNKMLYAAMMATAIAVLSGEAFAGGVLTGKVKFDGEVPAAKPLSFGAEKQCAMMHDKLPVNEELVVNANKTVKYTLVHLKGVSGTFTAPEEPVLIDQVGCMFLPHVSAAMKGQKINMKNSDAVLHNVRAAAKNNKSFNIAQPIQGMSTKKTFDAPELGIPLRCDVHFWMVAYVHVLDHPFFAVTGDDGSFTIKDVPPGSYTLESWHEKLGVQAVEVTVADGETKTLDLTYKAA